MNPITASALAPFAPPQSEVHQISEAARAQADINCINARAYMTLAQEKRLIEQQQQYLRAIGELT